jgi:hypothetical protein
MQFSEMLRMNMERYEKSSSEMSSVTGIPEVVIEQLQNPQNLNEKAVELFAKAFDVEVAVYKGEKEPEPSFDEKRDKAIANAKYPAVRAFFLAPPRCVDPEESMESFGDQPFSTVEQNLMHYICTSALCRFCDTETSDFAFDTYLFELHNPLLQRLVKKPSFKALPPEEQEELMADARTNVFACEKIKNIAILILDQFTKELDEHLGRNETGFYKEVGLPFTWKVEPENTRIVVREPDGRVRDEIELIDVKKKVQAGTP